MSVAGASLGSASGEIEIRIAEAMANIGALQQRLNTFGTQSQSAFAKAQGAGVALVGMGAGILGFLGAGTKLAADFEHQMSAVNAVTDATTAQFADLRQLALDLGKATSFSASEAAGAIEELAKAGVGIEDILGGAAKGATDLAAAAGIAVPRAAEIMATTLNIFSLAGTEAAHVADVFAAAAAKSATDADELSMALSQSGTVLAAFGVDLETSVGALALFADNSLKGSDAGTSLRTMLLSLVNPTDKASAEMERLGLSFFDASGEFIGIEAAAGQLRSQLAGLTEQERLTALEVIFGADAVRAANILYEEGAEGVAEYTAAVDDAGAAGQAAKERLDNLKGSLDQLRGSLETAGIVIGTFFLPKIRALVDAATKAVNAFLGLPAPVQKVAAILAAAAGSVALISGGFLLLAPRIMATATAFRALLPLLGRVVAGLGPLLIPIALVAAALAALGIAYKTNLGGFADAVNGLAGKITGAFAVMAGAIGPVADTLALFFSTPWKGGASKAALLDLLRDKLLGLGLSVDQVYAITDAVGTIAKPVRQLRNSFRDVTKGASLFVQKLFGTATGKEFKEFGARMRRLFGKDVGNQITKATAKLRTGIKGFTDSLSEATGIDFSKLLSLRGILDTLAAGFDRLVQFLRRDLIPALGPILLAVLNGATAALGFLARHMETITTVVGRVAELIGNTLANALRLVADLLTGDFAGAWDNLSQIGEDVFAAVSDGVRAIDWGAVWDLIVAGVTAAVGGVVPLGAIVVDAALALGEGILDGASDLWQWFLGKIGVGQPADTDLPNLSRAAGNTVSLGDVMISAALALGGQIAEWAGNLWGWVREQLGIGSGRNADLPNLSAAAGYEVPLGSVVLSAALGLLGDLADAAGRLGTWLEEKLVVGWGYGVDLATVLLSGVPELTGTLATAADGIATWLKDKLTKGAAVGVNLATVGLAGALTLAGTLETAAKGIATWLKDKLTKGAAVGINLATVGLAAVLKLAGTLGDAAGKMGTWLKEKLAVGWGYGVDLAEVVLSATLGLTGDLFAAAGTLGTWLGDKLLAGFDHAVAIGDVVLDTAVVTLGETLAFVRDDLPGYLMTAIVGFGGAKRHAVDAGTAVIDALPELGATLQKVADDVGAWIKGQLVGVGAAAGGDRTTPVDVGTIPIVGKVVVEEDKVTWGDVGTAIAAGVIGAIVDVSDLGRRIGLAIWAKVASIEWSGLFTNTDFFTLGSAIGAGIHWAIGQLAGLHVAIALAIQGAMEDLTVDDLKKAGDILAGVLVAVLSAGVIATAAISAAIAQLVAGAIAGAVFGKQMTFGEFTANLEAALVLAIEGAQEMGSDILDAIGAKIGAAAQNTTAFVAAAITTAASIVGAVVDRIAGFATFGRNILVAIAGVITPSGGDFNAEGTSIASQIGDMIVAGIQATMGAGRTLLLAIAQTLAVKPGDFKAEATAMAAALATGVIDWFIINGQSVVWESILDAVIPGGGQAGGGATPPRPVVTGPAPSGGAVSGGTVTFQVALDTTLLAGQIEGAASQVRNDWTGRVFNANLGATADGLNTAIGDAIAKTNLEWAYTGTGEPFNAMLSAEWNVEGGIPTAIEEAVGEVNASWVNVPPYKAKLSADATGWSIVLGNAQEGGRGFAATTFTGNIAGDRASWDDTLWGAIEGGLGFQATTFTSTLSADAGSAFAAIGAATGAAQGFARTYTATLTVDASGAIATAQAAAAAIAALLPHSPAKEGPLSHVPSFDYIGDALRDTLGRMLTDTEASMGAITDHLGAAMLPDGNAALRAQLAATSTGARGGATYVDARRFFALRQGEYAALLSKAERGDQAAGFIEDDYRTLSLVLG
jgi:TP901 family phage tail tape measure protein